jgi:hypothetical protein
MSRGLISRLDRLEAVASISRGARPWRRIIASSPEAADAKMAALVASGEASEGDNFICRIITDVPRSSHGVVQ